MQRMPLAFFVRTQTGALISRLNNDVIGAQQAFTTTLVERGRQRDQPDRGHIAMLALSAGRSLWHRLRFSRSSWSPHAMSAVALAEMTRDSMQMNADMSSTMTERFNVSGALLVKLFGRLDVERDQFSSRAAQVADIGVRIAMANRALLRRSHADRIACDCFGLWESVASWPSTAPDDGTSRSRSARPAHAALRPADGALQRAHRRDDSACQLRAGLRGARPSSDDCRPARTPRDFRRGQRQCGSSTLTLATRPQTRSRWHRLRSWPAQTARQADRCCTTSRSKCCLVRWWRSWGRRGQARPPSRSLIPRLYDVTDGRVLWADTTSVTSPWRRCKSRIGVVTQDAHLFHDTIEANLRYAAPDASESELWNALRSARIAELIASLPDGLGTVVGDRGHRLSGGEKQRLAIARLLLKSPSVVILDEATAHLDSESERFVQAALDSALVGRTSLVIAHRLSTVRAADLIVVVDDGRIVERGDHESLLAGDGLYADLYRTQFAPQFSDRARRLRRHRSE